MQYATALESLGVKKTMLEFFLKYFRACKISQDTLFRYHLQTKTNICKFL